MALYRVYLIFNFNGTPETGFSETYDIDAASDAAAQDVACRISQNRANFLSSDWFIVAVRLALLEAANHAGKCIIKAKRIIFCPACANLVGVLGSADTPAAAVFADFFYQNVKKPSHRQFRGIPDDWWINGTLTSAKESIGTFCNRLKTLGHVRVISSGTVCALSQFPLKCCDTRRISSRRVGRPFGLLRGRRSKKPT